MISDVKLNLEMQKKLALIFVFAYNYYTYRDIPGFMPMVFMGNVVYNSYPPKESCDDISSNDANLRALNLITVSSILTSSLFFETSFLNPFLGLIMGEVLTGLIQDITDEIDEELESYNKVIFGAKASFN